jgi:hypothetical protein
MSRYAIARFPTPVLNTPEFSTCFGNSELPLDAQQLLRPVETVLLPNSKIELMHNVDSLIWQIRTEEYPGSYYIDERFVAFVEDSHPERTRTLLPVDVLVKDLQTQIGLRYIWGGNWPKGIPELLEWYCPCIDHAERNPLIYETWQLRGVDCSGLLYYVTNGYTPRNTSQLVNWGKSVAIAEKSSEAIARTLSPLDLIVWQGHVLIALDPHTVIESKPGVGVVISSLSMRLEEILSARKPVNSYINDQPSFVIRRWHPEIRPFT